MIASILILIFSLILFLYWFRYTCLLVLQTETSEKNVRQVVSANQLNFVTVQKTLNQGGEVALDSLHLALENDYRVLTFLLDHAASLRAGSVEDRMLLLDYKLMQVWYRLRRGSNSPQARQALEEMSRILGYFANSMGQHFAVHSQSA